VGRCDFCDWRRLTAVDEGFGRIELPGAVTASNLFKYASPGHGLALFKHHDPLSFEQPQLSDLLDASWLWFCALRAAQQPQPSNLWPFLLWNALPRAGASQFHGHAQLTLTEAPVPAALRLTQASERYAIEHGECYHADLLRAHAAAGLLRRICVRARTTQGAVADAAVSRSGSRSSLCGPGSVESAAQRLQSPPSVPELQHVAWALVSLSPVKDMEVVVVGDHLCCPAFGAALHVSLRALIDGCGCRTFNVGVHGIDLDAPPPAGAGLERLHWQPSSPGAASGIHVAAQDSDRDGSSDELTADAEAPPPVSPWFKRRPVVARVVSRGKLSSIASDYGALEVFGGASIGHTDPFAVLAALDVALSKADARCGTPAAGMSTAADALSSAP
jgi:hypothetical protein